MQELDSISSRPGAFANDSSCSCDYKHHEAYTTGYGPYSAPIYLVILQTGLQGSTAVMFHRRTMKGCSDFKSVPDFWTSSFAVRHSRWKTVESACPYDIRGFLVQASTRRPYPLHHRPLLWDLAHLSPEYIKEARFSCLLQRRDVRTLRMSGSRDSHLDARRENSAPVPPSSAHICETDFNARSRPPPMVFL